MKLIFNRIFYKTLWI